MFSDQTQDTLQVTVFPIYCKDFLTVRPCRGWGVGVGGKIFSPEPKPALAGPDSDYFHKHYTGCSLQRKCSVCSVGKKLTVGM